MSTPIYTVDAFTDQPFSGNPAAVCLLEAPRDAEWMQSVAREMNLSETAFLVPHEGDGFDLRWFTPTAEVRLCGHATLASAHTLWESGTLPARVIARFHTKSGVLTATRTADGIEMDFPSRAESKTKAPKGLLESLGLETAVYVGQSAEDFLVELSSERAVRDVEPDFGALVAVEARGVIVTSRAKTAGGGNVGNGGSRGEGRGSRDERSGSHVAGSASYDFVSRFFAPRFGVNEDPVTGSAHCTLAPYWTTKLDRPELIGRQISSRGGTVRVKVEGDRVLLGGTAVTVMKGLLI